MHRFIPKNLIALHRGIAAVLAVVLLLTAGCGKDEESARRDDAAADSTRRSIAPALEGSVLVDSVRADVTGDGVSELIVTSRVQDSVDDPLLLDRFDRLDIYRQDADGYLRLFVDAIDYGASLRCEDVTGDGISDVLVRLDAGGNNPITTQGLHIYGLDSRKAMVLLFYSASGAPVLRDLDGDSRGEVLVSDQYWGMMAHSEVIGYTREIYTFRGDSYEMANRAFSKWYDGILKTRRRAYEQARRAADSDEGKMQLYLQTAEYLVWNYARGGAERLNRVWLAEKTYLQQHLSDEQYNDLDTFVDEVTTEEFEQREQRVS